MAQFHRINSETLEAAVRVYYYYYMRTKLTNNLTGNYIINPRPNDQIDNIPNIISWDIIIHSGFNIILSF